MTIGVAITTHRRPQVRAKTLHGWAQALDGVATLVVVHDEDGRGVAWAKNRSIELLIDAGVEHLFLADDDVHPITPGWWRPYVASPHPHLMHCWGRSRLLREEDGHTLWSWPRGSLLYAHRSVIDRVGGMRTEFRHAGEHVEWSRRIHNAGLTPWPFMDAAAARRGIWHCEDYTRSTPSSLPGDRYSPEETARRHQLYEQFRGSTDFVDYRTPAQGAPR